MAWAARGVDARVSQGWGWLARRLPGLALVTGVALVAVVVEAWTRSLLGHSLAEALVLALLLGAILRNTLRLPAAATPGIQFAAKSLLEVVVALLGAGVSLPVLLAAGPTLLLLVTLAVVVGIGVSLLLGHLLGLEPRLALLVAVGNAIGGNSAIAAVAPIIRATQAEVASAVAVTAVLGLAAVLPLPLTISLAGLDHYQYGVLAGMTVYAVPQALAAAFPVGQLAGEVATLVKLTRVMLLAPVVLSLTLVWRRVARQSGGPASLFPPWFITAFLALTALRSVGLLADTIALPLRDVSRPLMVLAMAGLGLGVNVAAVRAVGPRVFGAVAGSLALLVALGLLLIRAFGLAG